jgi:hypothetical protein
MIIMDVDSISPILTLKRITAIARASDIDDGAGVRKVYGWVE